MRIREARAGVRRHPRLGEEHRVAADEDRDAVELPERGGAIVAPGVREQARCGARPREPEAAGDLGGVTRGDGGRARPLALEGDQGRARHRRVPGRARGEGGRRADRDVDGVALRRRRVVGAREARPNTGGHGHGPEGEPSLLRHGNGRALLSARSPSERPACFHRIGTAATCARRSSGSRAMRPEPRTYLPPLPTPNHSGKCFRAMFVPSYRCEDSSGLEPDSLFTGQGACDERTALVSQGATRVNPQICVTPGRKSSARYLGSFPGSIFWFSGPSAARRITSCRACRSSGSEPPSGSSRRALSKSCQQSFHRSGAHAANASALSLAAGRGVPSQPASGLERSMWPRVATRRVRPRPPRVHNRSRAA